MNDRKDDYLYYKEIFNEQMREGVDILTSKGDLLETSEDEEFRQCYSPDDKRRSVLPYSWFVSNKGNLLIVKKNGDITWRKKSSEGSTYEGYIYTHPQTGKQKNINIHNLIGLVFDSMEFGRASELMDKKNLYAFGDKSDKDHVNGHHIKAVRSCPEEKYDPTNIEFLTVRAHEVVHSFPDEDATLEEKAEFVKRLNELVDTEVPGKVVAVVGGKGKEIRSFDNLTFGLSQQAYDQLKGIFNGLRILQAVDTDI